ncbi:MAG: flippase [Candidatus Bathyarchaeia archaeon]
MSENKRFWIDFVTYAPSQFIPALIGFISVSILTRLISPEQYGQYVLVMTTVSLLTILTGWVPMSFIRFYPAAEHNGQLGRLCTSALIGLIGSVLIVSILGGAIFLRVGSRLDLLFTGGALFVLMAVFDSLHHFLRAEFKAKEYTLFSIWRAVAGLGLGVGMVLVFDRGVEGLLWGHAVSLVLALPFLWRIAIGPLPKTGLLSGDLVKGMLAYGFPLVVGNLSAWMLSLSDRYILEHFRGTYELGIYSASYTIAEKSIALVAYLFHFVSIPMTVQVWEKDETRARDFVSITTRYYLLLCLPLAVGMGVLSRPIIEVLMGEAYQEGYRILPFVVTGGFLLGLQQRFQSSLVVSNKTFLIMVSLFIGGVVNIVCNLIFVPRYGYIAAAVNTLVGYAVATALMVIFSQKYWAWVFPFGSLAKISVSALLMGITVHLITSSIALPAFGTLLIGLIVGFVIYFAASFWLRELRSQEIRSICRIGVRLFWKVRNGPRGHSEARIR